MVHDRSSNINVYILRSNRRQRRSFGECSVLKCLSMAHFFSKNSPRAESPFLHVVGSRSNVLQNDQKWPSRQGAFLEKKCAIDRHLSTEYGLSLGRRGAKSGGLKCLSMAHLCQIYTSGFDYCWKGSASPGQHLHTLGDMCFSIIATTG